MIDTMDFDTTDDDRIALLMRATDPYPAPERDVLSDTQLLLRDHIATGSRPSRRPRLSAVRRFPGVPRWVRPVSAIAATAAVVAVSVAVGAAALSVRTAPLAGDPDAGDGVNPLFSSDFEAARDRAASDFELRVLEDNVITSTEYDEAVGLYVQCVREAGLTIRTHDAGGGLRSYEIGGSWDSDGANRIAGDCSIGTINVIEGLYGQITQNPSKDEWHDLVAACLVTAGFVNSPYTGDLYAMDATEPVFVQSIMDDPDAAACVAAPQG